MKVKSESEVAQSCLTLSDPMDCSPPGSSIHGIFQARVLEWAAMITCLHIHIFKREAVSKKYKKMYLGYKTNSVTKIFFKKKNFFPMKKLAELQLSIQTLK